MDLPKKEIKHPLTVEVEAELLRQVKAQAKKDDVSLRAIVEYGISQYLLRRKADK